MGKYGAKGASILLIGSALVAFGAPAMAQITPADADAGGAGEIVVTARKQSEELQKVPISIRVVTGEQLAKFGSTDLQSVAQSVPNFYIDKVPSNPRISIRGFGTLATSQSFDMSVGLSIDGVYFARPRWFDIGLFDIDHVEVLRGPQGVYFGKNTTAGLVNIQSRGPTDKLEGYFRAGYEFKYDEFLAEGAVGGPITDNFGARLAVQHRSSKGWIRNLAIRKREPATDSTLGRLTLDWHPTDRLHIVYKGQYGSVDVDGVQSENQCSAAFAATLKPPLVEDCVINGTRSAGKGFPGGIFANVVQDKTDLEVNSHGLTADLELGGFTLTSVTAYQHLKMSMFFDTDFNDRPLLEANWPEKHSAFSQEIRLTTPHDLPVSAVVGAYYEHSKLDVLDAALDLAGIGSRTRNYRQRGDAIGLFGEVTWKITDALRVVGGGRYTHETKKADLQNYPGPLGSRFPANGDPFNAPLAPVLLAIGNSPILFKDKRKFHNFSPSATIQYDLDRNVMAYASYKEGFKSGGFDNGRVGIQTVPFGPITPTININPEKVKAYEAGVKGSFFDRRVTVDIAGFRNKFSDLQETIYDAQTATSFAQNAAKATIEGVEIDSSWNITPDLSLNAAGSYIHSKYSSFPAGACYPGQTVVQGCVGNKQNLTGQRLPLASKWSGSFGYDWSHDFQRFIVSVSGQASYRSSIFLTAENDPNQLQKGYWLFDGRIAVSNPAKVWTAALIGKNLFDKRYFIGSVPVSFAPAGSYNRTIGNPRTIQIQLTYKF